MSDKLNVTNRHRSVTSRRDTSRAQETLRVGVTVSRVTTKRDVTVDKRDSDIRAERSSHHHETGRKAGMEKTSWMHIAALNLVADHDAGKHVDTSKLELARRLLGQPYAPARICSGEA